MAQEPHRVRVVFEDGCTHVRLIHPETGECNPSEVCASCHADLRDPNSKRCYDCPAGPGEECWLQGWIDEYGAEVLQGTVEFPVDTEWDGDAPVVKVSAEEAAA